MAVALDTIKIDGRRIVLHRGTAFSISAIIDGKKEEILLEEAPDGTIDALFPKDDVYFSININNEKSKYSLVFEIVANHESSWYNVAPQSKEKLEALTVNGQKLQKLYYKHEDDVDDDNGDDDVCREDEKNGQSFNHSIKSTRKCKIDKTDKSPVGCSRMRFSIRVEKPAVQAVVRPLSPHICWCGPRNTCIYLNTSSNKLLPLMVDLQFTVECLHYLFKDKYDTDVRFVYNKLILKNKECTLRDYGICEDSVLKCIPVGLTQETPSVSISHEDALGRSNRENTPKNAKIIQSCISYDIQPFLVNMRLNPSLVLSSGHDSKVIDSDKHASDQTVATVYVNDLLCYIQNSSSHDQEDTIRKNVMSCYDNSEIASARQLLIRVCKNQLIEAYLQLPRVRKGPNKKELYFKDILQILNLLPTANAPIFVAKDKAISPIAKVMTGHVVSMTNEIAHLKSEVNRLLRALGKDQQNYTSLLQNHEEGSIVSPAISESGANCISPSVEEATTWASIVSKKP